MTSAKSSYAPSTPAIIVEVKKLVASFFDISVYNLPFQKFIPLLDPNLIINRVDMLSIDENGEYFDTFLDSPMTINEFVDLLNNSRNITHSDLSMELSDSQTIDTNFSDEIFCTLSSSIEINTLITKVLNEDQQGSIVGFPNDRDAFCLVKTGSQISQYRSLKTYIANTGQAKGTDSSY